MKKIIFSLALAATLGNFAFAEGMDKETVKSMLDNDTMKHLKSRMLECKSKESMEDKKACAMKVFHELKDKVRVKQAQ